MALDEAVLKALSGGAGEREAEEDTEALRRVRALLKRLMDVRLPPEARKLVRDAYGAVGDDTQVGMPSKTELEAIDGLIGSSE